MVTPWDSSLYFYQALEWDINYGYECETCGEKAKWELQYIGSGCAGEERFLCDTHYKKEFSK